MVSVSRPTQEAGSIRAIPLTTIILKNAINWLRKGSTNSAENYGENVEELVVTYLRELEERIPSGKDVKELRDFIIAHDWAGRDINKFMSEIDGLDSDMKRSYSLREFIHRELAKQTKVAAHFVDGNHRAAVLNWVLVGSGEDEDVLGAYYETSCPHAELLVRTIIIIPTDDSITNTFVEEMQKLSMLSQSTMSKQQPHTIKDHICHAIEFLTRSCKRENIKFLWDVLEAKGRETPIETSEEAIDNYMLQFSTDISYWIGKVLKQIHHVVRYNAGKLKITGSMKSEESRHWNMWQVLFKNKVRSGKKMEYSEHFDIFPFSKDMMLSKFMQSESDDVFKEGRFNRAPHKDLDLIVAHILLWSMLSNRTNGILIELFSGSNPTECQKNGDPGADAETWTMNFFHSVTESTYHSYPIWKENFFVKNRNFLSTFSFCLAL
jgi:hypothetical protein